MSDFADSNYASEFSLNRSSSISAPKRLGDVLMEKEVITPEQLQAAIKEQKNNNKKLGATLVDLKFLTTERLASALAEQMHLPMISLKNYNFNDDTIKMLPQNTARRLQAVVLEEKSGSFLVTVADPFDLQIYDELVRILQKDVLLAVSPADQILNALDRVYRKTDEIRGLAKKLEKEVGDSFTFNSNTTADDDTPVVKFIQTIFEDAVQAGASDVHVEPLEDRVLIRFRIDSILHKQTSAEKKVAGAIVQRLKLMSGLDISEKRLPQDGRFELNVRNEGLDVRISTLPTQFGESVVMRLLRQGGNINGLNTLGMPLHVYNRMLHLIEQANGMILVTGPTGSGKTTTLYSVLGALDASEMKLLTVEDPIEYRLPGVIQTQVNDKIELTFSKVLRSALRQDPDVILVGEIRDNETAEIAMRAAITGHMVLSTLHTKDAASTPLRLVDMGIPPYMVATSLQAVIAQRLIRVNCEYCGENHAPTDIQKNWLKSVLGHTNITQKVGKGCQACNGSGYSGRTAVYEMFEMDQELIDLAASRNMAEFSKKAYNKMQNKTMMHHALELVRNGKTTLSEAMKVSPINETYTSDHDETTTFPSSSSVKGGNV